jgi:OST-HTH Associated domain/OST-HTH/LOTUS domain
MIKLTGPSDLNSLSLGKLCSFVQKALNLNILIYYKTLLIRNNQFDNSSQNASNEAKNAKKISTLKDQILTLLVENKVGLSLAQIPLLLKNKFKKSYNIQSLGFPKLKNLLATMDEVDLEKTQGNLLKAVLKTHIRKNSEKPLEEVSKNNLGGKKFLTLRTNPLDHKLNNLHYSSNMHGNFFQSQEPTSHPVKGCRTVSTLEDYILKIQSTILDILRSNIFGIEVEKLKNELDRWAGVEFNYRIAGAESFQEFLINNLGDYLDIEIKKSLRSAKASGPLIHIVYPKNYKLPQPPKHFFMEEDRNDRFNDEFSNLSPNSLHHYLHSPDASFINCVKPLLNSKYPNIDASNFKSSQSFNIGKSADCPPGGLLETLSQQGSSTGGELPSSCKSTLSQHQYSHFGKFKAAKGAKATPHDFKLGSQLLKAKDHYRHGKQRTAPQTEIDWISNCQDVDRFAGQVSFENEGLHLTRPADYSASKKQDQGLAAKPTDVAEDLSDAQSQKVLDRLLADEE